MHCSRICDLDCPNWFESFGWNYRNEELSLKMIPGETQLTRLDLGVILLGVFWQARYYIAEISLEMDLFE